MSERLKPYLLVNIILAGIIVMVIMYSAFFSPEKNNHPVKCVHEQITGMPCPSCGMSHSFSYIVRGDLKSAVECNIYGLRVFLFFLFHLVMRISNIVILRFRKPDLRKLVILDVLLAVISFILAFSQFILYNWQLIS